MDLDKDLQSIQEVRWLVAKAVVAQKELAKMSQQQVDGIAKAIADACAAQFGASGEDGRGGNRIWYMAG